MGSLIVLQHLILGQIFDDFECLLGAVHYVFHSVHHLFVLPGHEVMSALEAVVLVAQIDVFVVQFAVVFALTFQVPALFV